MEETSLLSLPNTVISKIVEDMWDLRYYENNKNIMNVSFTCKELNDILQEKRNNAKKVFLRISEEEEMEDGSLAMEDLYKEGIYHDDDGAQAPISDSDDKASNLSNLPNDILCKIAKNLDDNEEVINLSFTCKELYEILQKIREDAKEEFIKDRKEEEEFENEYEMMMEKQLDEWMEGKYPYL